MKGIWAVVVLTIRDGIRGKAWFPFSLGILACVVLMLGGFGLRNMAAGRFYNDYSINIVSHIFNYWAWGTILTALWVASGSFPKERRAPMLFTLPLARWKIAVGKLIGVEILTAVVLAVGYGLCASMIAQAGVSLVSYSLLGFTTALTISFLYACLSIPLGIRLPPIVAGIISLMVVGITDVTDALKNAHYISNNWFVWVIEHLFPWRISNDSLTTIFYRKLSWSSQEYVGLLLNAMIGVAFFAGLSFLMRRDELSLKDPQ